MMNTWLRTAIVTCALGLSAFSAAKAEAADVFLKLAEFKGDSTYKGHEDEVSVVSWSWGTTTGGNSSSGGAGRPQIQELKLTKAVDLSSPKFVESLLSGRHLRSGTLVMMLPGVSNTPFIRISLTDILVTSVRILESKAPNGAPFEEVTLNFAGVEYTVTPTDRTGKASTPVTVKFDAKAMKVN